MICKVCNKNEEINDPEFMKGLPLLFLHICYKCFVSAKNTPAEYVIKTMFDFALQQQTEIEFLQANTERELS